MADEWFYAVNDEPKGPVGAGELIALEREGIVRADTLVWTQGLAGWQRWADAAGEARSAAESKGEETLIRCAFSGEHFPRSEVVKYGDQYVGIRHKEAFLQALRDGRVVAAMPGAGGMEFVGFWWRVLASIIDWAVKLVPNILCMVPYYLVVAGGAVSPGTGNGESELWAMALVAAYGLGLLANLGLSIFYDTWMVGKYGGTVGKLALGFRVVNEDGSKVSYVKAFARWAAEIFEKFIAMVIAYGVMAVGIILAFTAGLGFAKDSGPGFVIAMIFGFLLVGALSVFLAFFPWFMAGWTRQKKALHDFMCATRVVRHQTS